MIRFLSTLPAEQLARELATALGNKGAPRIESLYLYDDGAIDLTAPHRFALTDTDWLYPHDGTTPDGARGFDYRHRWYVDGKVPRVRAVLARLGCVEAPEHVS